MPPYSASIFLKTDVGEINYIMSVSGRCEYVYMAAAAKAKLECIIFSLYFLISILVVRNMYRILIVEDDIGIAAAVKKQIETWDLEAKCVDNFHDVLSCFTEYDPHLVLLDISLPFFNGYHWCSEIRRISQVPVIFISSASDNMNIVMAMNMGGDDFIAKPFDNSVLMAKTEAILPRTYDYSSRITVLEHRGVMLNTADASIIFNGEKIDLTKNEYKIMQTLMENKGKVVSRDRLMQRLWESDSYVDENTLSVNVNRLRKKLDGAGIPDFITTKVGMGYIVE